MTAASVVEELARVWQRGSRGPVYLRADPVADPSHPGRL